MDYFQFKKYLGSSGVTTLSDQKELNLLVGSCYSIYAKNELTIFGEPTKQYSKNELLDLVLDDHKKAFTLICEWYKDCNNFDQELIMFVCQNFHTVISTGN